MDGIGIILEYKPKPCKTGTPSLDSKLVLYMVKQSKESTQNKIFMAIYLFYSYFIYSKSKIYAFSFLNHRALMVFKL